VQQNSYISDPRAVTYKLILFVTVTLLCCNKLQGQEIHEQRRLQQEYVMAFQQILIHFLEKLTTITRTLRHNTQLPAKYVPVVKSDALPPCQFTFAAMQMCNWHYSVHQLIKTFFNWINRT